MPHDRPKTPAEVAEAYVKSFQEGSVFVPPSAGLLSEGEPDPQALHVLELHLAEESAPVRENIVNLLADVGSLSLSYRIRGIVAIHDSRIIRILARQGLSKPDVARERAMELLRKLCLQPALASESREFHQAFREKPSDEALLLLAKARTVEAKEEVDVMGQLPEWQNERTLLITRAALGDTVVAHRFLSDLEVANSEGDARKFEQTTKALSLIGTPAVLNVLAEHMRTPLVLDIVGAYQKSMRLAVLEGLYYNYPDERVLYPNNVSKEEDFRNAERFCERTLGAVYREPVPPFMTYGGYPCR